MPSLTNWLHEKYDQLESNGKGDLADLTEDVRTATFTPDPVAFAQCAREARVLADYYDEPLVRATVDYYTAFGEVAWQGNLSKALDTATSTLILAQSHADHACPLLFYLHEQLSTFWLCVDAPGYASQVQEICQHLEESERSPDLDARLRILEASATVAADPSQGEAELVKVNTVVQHLRWPQPYLDIFLAEALGWAHRIDEALQLFSRGIGGLDTWPDPHAAAQSRMQAAELLLDSQCPAEAEALLEEALQLAETVNNRGLTGLAQGALGNVAMQCEDYQSAANWFDHALVSLDELGWHRAEARYALSAAQATLDVRPAYALVAFDQARQRVDRLKSHDLAPTLIGLKNLVETLL